MLKEKLNEFIKVQKENDLDIKTIEDYRKVIVTFIKYVNSMDININDHLEIKRIYQKYIEQLEKLNYKPGTINKIIIIINKFFKLNEIEVRHKLLKIQNKTYISNVLNENEYRRLLEVVKNKRDRAIIIFLANTGLRISEALSLTVRDINKDVILVKGKKGKYREMFLSPTLKIVLNEYVGDRKKGKLFLGKTGELTRQAVYSMLYRNSKKARIKKGKVHPHALRHLFGKRLADKGISLDVIATYLGHEDIKTTAIYTKRNKNELINVLEENFIK